MQYDSFTQKTKMSRSDHYDTNEQRNDIVDFYSELLPAISRDSGSNPMTWAKTVPPPKNYFQRAFLIAKELRVCS